MGKTRRKIDPKITEALDMLSGLFEFGALMAATEPAAFILLVCDEITRNRTALKRADEAFAAIARIDCPRCISAQWAHDAGFETHAVLNRAAPHA